MIEHPALDTLHRMLRLHQLRAAFFANPTLCDEWQLRFEGEHRLTFHHVQSGQCTLQVDGAPSQRIHLTAGDLAVIPQARAHVLSSSATNQPEHAATTLLCGAIDIERDDRSPLLDALPSDIVIRAQDTSGQSSLRRLLELMLTKRATSQTPVNSFSTNSQAHSSRWCCAITFTQLGLRTGCSPRSTTRTCSPC